MEHDRGQLRWGHLVTKRSALANFKVLAKYTAEITSPNKYLSTPLASSQTIFFSEMWVIAGGSGKLANLTNCLFFV
jgi:hypothetical protein